MVQGIQFNEYHPERVDERKQSKMISWVMRIFGGTIKNEEQAALIMIIASIVAILISLVTFFLISGESTIKVPAGKQIVYPEGEPPRVQ